MILAVIPARGGSRRVHGKNIKSFHGKPIIAYSIEAAMKSGLFDRIVVSTDSDDIASVALHYGADVVKRAPWLALDEIGTRQVIFSAAQEIGAVDCVCGIYATAPLMSVHDIVSGYSLLNEYKRHAISVGYPPLQDAAQFYWSTKTAIEEDVEYFDSFTALVKIPSERVCDINTEQDWIRAEEMYAALNN